MITLAEEFSVEESRSARFTSGRAVAGLVVAGGTVRHGCPALLRADVRFALCTFVAVTVVIEFFKGAIAIRGEGRSENIFAAMVELTHRNDAALRGGYLLVHMGIVFMFIGFTGKAFDLDKTVQVQKGDKVNLGAYQLTNRARLNPGKKRKTVRGIF